MRPLRSFNNGAKGDTRRPDRLRAGPGDVLSHSGTSARLDANPSPGPAFAVRENMRSMQKTASLLAAVCGATLSAGGCRDTECSPAVTFLSCDSASGMVTIAGPPSYGPPTSVSVSATTCLDQNGSCIDPERIDVEAWFGTNNGGSAQFTIEVTLPALDGAATFTLPGPVFGGLPMFSGSLYESLQVAGDPAQFTTFSGTIVATHSTGDTFEATFALQLETTDQMAFTLTDGQVRVSGCKYVTWPEMCEPRP